MESCTQALSILSRVWKVILDTRLIVEYFARYRTHTRVELESCTQAMSMLSRVWEVVLKL